MAQHHDGDDKRTTGRSPANRLGLDYRQPPARKIATPIIDVHTHVHNVGSVAAFMEAATLYGVERIASMTPVDEVAPLRTAYPGRLDFIAIPRWRSLETTEAFRQQWLADLGTFRALGARRMKFWMAPPMRGNYGLTLQDPFFRPLIQRGIELGFDFMIHVGDPGEWFQPGGRYADTKRYGTKADQYPQLEFLLERVAPRNVVAAHLGGCAEDPAFLQQLLDRFPNLYLDTSATKWVVRAVARQPEALRAFVIHNQDRLLFGSDIVVAEAYNFEHYASRYWTHQTLWESDYRGESPIEDPDADNRPALLGLDLPAPVLRKLYAENAVRLGYFAAPCAAP